MPRDAVKSALMIRPGGLGDAALTWPMLTALRKLFVDARIDVLAERRNAGIYELADAAPRVYRYDVQPLRTWRALRNNAYDLIIDTEQYHATSAVYANALRPQWLCGFNSLGRDRLQSHGVMHDEDSYAAESFLKLATAVSGETQRLDGGSGFIPLDVHLRERAGELLSGAPEHFVAVCPGAGDRFRQWSATRYTEVCNWLTDRGVGVVLLGGRDCAAAADIICAAATSPPTNLVGKTSLGESAAVLSRAHLSVSADTGILHLAAGVGTPTVSLFGPGRHRQWAPRGDRHRVVRLGLDCSPCIRDGRLPPCPHGIACMNDLPVRAVTEAVEPLL